MGLTFIAIVLLAGAWAAILLPDLRNRGGAPRRNNSVKSFNQQLSGLDRTRPQGMYRPGMSSRAPIARRESPMYAPRPRGTAARPGAPTPAGRVRPNPPLVARSSTMPRTRAEAAKRRLATVSVLATLALLTLVGGVLLSRTLLFAHVVVDALLAGFVYLAWERSKRTGARRSSLVTLGDERPTGGRRGVTGRGPLPVADELDDLASVSPLTRRASGD